ncbi:hypothetical protein CDD83_5742 [Cordyceps sp. RAO-2017]|nr:hypothetical protein CDD83_5742 [Cordyceps sp. RAO-2017]
MKTCRRAQPVQAQSRRPRGIKACVADRSRPLPSSIVDALISDANHGRRGHTHGMLAGTGQRTHSSPGLLTERRPSQVTHQVAEDYAFRQSAGTTQRQARLRGPANPYGRRGWLGGAARHRLPALEQQVARPSRPAFSWPMTLGMSFHRNARGSTGFRPVHGGGSLGKGGGGAALKGRRRLPSS